MYIIEIPDFYIDSLTNWDDVYDVLEVHTFLTLQQAKVAHKFHIYSDIGMKAHVLYNLIDLMLKNSSALSEQQFWLVVELINFDTNYREDLIASFNKIASQAQARFMLAI